jgi:hypothetical protein
MQTETTSIISLDAMEQVNKALDYCRSVQNVEIKNNDQAEAAGKLYRELNTHIKSLDSLREKEKRPHLEAGRAVDSFFKDPITAVTNLKNRVNKAIVDYQAELRRKQEEEQRRLNAQAEAKRREEEEKARIAREKAEALRAEGKDSQAEKWEQKAEAREEKAETIVAPVAQVASPVLEGISIRKTWKGRVTDPIAFVKHCIKNDLPQFLLPNEKALSDYAKMMQQKVTFPGAETYEEQSASGRSL